MRKNRIFAGIFGALGLFLAVGVIFTAFASRQAQPRLMAASEDAQERAQKMMEAACSGDYETAGSMMRGTPDLGRIPEGASVSASMIWEAFLDSLEYDFPGGCYATEQGMTIDVHVRGLNISSVTTGVKKRAENILNQRVEAAEDISEIYDEKNNYREELVESVLQNATSEALKQDAQYQETTIPLYLIYEQDQWWVMPSQELLNVLSGAETGR